MIAWRKVDRVIYDEFFDWVRNHQKRRMEEGLAKYQSEKLGFQGDPLQHALEEQLDALFCIYYAMREREYLAESKDELNTNHLSKWERFLRWIELKR